MSLRLSSYFAIGFLLLAEQNVSHHTLTIAAASDLTNLEPDLGSSFRKIDPAIQLSWVTASSAVLAQQIRNGAPYDVFLSANAQFVDELASNRNLLPASVTRYAVGRLGMLWRDRKHHEIKELAGKEVRFVALPNPQLAPYGLAARQALEHWGLWGFVREKAIYGENVRQTLQLFESGNADAVLTAYSLLQGKDPTLIPADWHQPIVQKAGIVASTKNLEAARKFLHFLTSPAGQTIFAKFGFGKVGV